MQEKEIKDIVDAALADEFELDRASLVDDAHIREDLGLDSLDIVDLVIVIENAFNFKLEDRSKLAGIQTLGDLYRFIRDIYEHKSFVEK
ncbi:MAG: phosphopantetheine-binding protein [Desulfovibrio sp.]|nr:phosphopantetheine-binding protein [Desulfovibrio sp.]